MIKENENNELDLYVYNLLSRNIRKVVIIPNSQDS